MTRSSPYVGAVSDNNSYERIILLEAVWLHFGPTTKTQPAFKIKHSLSWTERQPMIDTRLEALRARIEMKMFVLSDTVATRRSDAALLLHCYDRPNQVHQQYTAAAGSWPSCRWQLLLRFWTESLHLAKSGKTEEWTLVSSYNWWILEQQSKWQYNRYVYNVHVLALYSARR